MRGGRAAKNVEIFRKRRLISVPQRAVRREETTHPTIHDRSRHIPFHEILCSLWSSNFGHDDSFAC